jgi:hypothetical protein
MATYTINIDDQYVPSSDPIDTNEGYVNMVMNLAAKSYQNHYKAQTLDDSITVARVVYNASISGIEYTPPMTNDADLDQLIIDYLEGDL